MIKSINEVDIREVNGKETAWPRAKLSVVSHHNWEDFVILQLPRLPTPPDGDNEGTTLVVSARDLETAIKNAKNFNRHG